MLRSLNPCSKSAREIWHKLNFVWFWERLNLNWSFDPSTLLFSESIIILRENILKSIGKVSNFYDLLRVSVLFGAITLLALAMDVWALLIDVDKRQIQGWQIPKRPKQVPFQSVLITFCQP